MEYINIDIKNIKNIKSANVQFPLEPGIYAIVGENSCGKSTLMLALSLAVKLSSRKMLKAYDLKKDSHIILQVADRKDMWINSNNKLQLSVEGNEALENKTQVRFHGFYEGSIFYGSRFDDYNKIDEFMKTKDFPDSLIDAQSFVTETLGKILHNDKGFYKQMKKVNNATAKKYHFKRRPYFIEVDGHFISQYRMSSGESMLISLIDFINNLVVQNSVHSQQLLFLIDEVELALHPAAIDRLIEVLNSLMKENYSKLIIYFSTHSAELINRLNCRNIFLIENNQGNIDVINPCYPNYAVRSLYIPNGFDFLLLVEDELAKALVEKVIREEELFKSKLCCVLPAGGYIQMLKLHHDMITYNTLGIGKKIISICDGDVKEKVIQSKNFKDLPKYFLPIPSIEKYFYKKLIIENNRDFIKLIGDKYFTQRSLEDILKDYKNDSRTKNNKDTAGKHLYSVLCSCLKKNGLSEERFVEYLCDDIYKEEKESINKFANQLKKLMM